ncbi:hypothetical protein [Plantactinospora sp. BB1]|uniref:hypothetical protein n=1 Tax=Plantactinospora sp. BB1 TaxID=2071627 RepID=UPI000D161D2F|nr:hypothetical protein [Plantactinospora sp. BB1]AVT38240.1 hypothetical protein C6W10_19340 [Plantactinospora sp. BB1]
MVAGGYVARRLLGRSEEGDGQWPQRLVGRRKRRWHVATVNRPVDRIGADGQLPEPLTGLGDAVEIQLRPAAGDRGTEIAVRLRDGARLPAVDVVRRAMGRDPEQAIRAALREAKQLIETSEVLHPDHPPTTETTPLNKPLQVVTRHGRREGRL